MSIRHWRATFTAAALLFAATLAAKDADHPLVGRYEGSELVGHHHFGFDEIEVIDAPIAGTTRGIGAPGWKKLEGESDLYYYRLPTGRSSLEMLRNYEASLKTKGFVTLYSCTTQSGSCYLQRENRSPDTSPYDFGLALDMNPEWPRLDGDFIRNFFRTNARYLLMRKDGDPTVWVSLTIAEGKDIPYAFVRVVETKAMDTGKITFVGADQMKSALADAGRISLYGIQFDFDKDAIKPESAATLIEIAKLLRADPALSLEIVGHTDDQGKADYNLDLSRRRAAAVKRSLIEDHGIGESRLATRGAGAGEPVAANADEAGRAKNRRVELVRRNGGRAGS